MFINKDFLKEKTGTKEISTPKSTSKSTPKSTPKSDLPENLLGLTLREQILVLIKKDPSISKKKMTEILGVSMYKLKKEVAAMAKEHVAEFVGFSRNGKWVVH